MKKILLSLTLLIVLASCSKPEPKNAIKKTVALLEHLQKHEYDKMADYYSDEFNASESPEKRKQKFEEIEAAVGPMTGFEFDQFTEVNVDERDMLELKYNVKYGSTYLTHSFIVAMEEGKLKILRHSIANK